MAYKSIGLALSAVLFLAGTVVGATEDPAPREGRGRTFLVLRIAEALELSDEQALRVSKIFQDAHDRRQALHQKRRDMTPDLQRAVDAKDEAEIERLVREARDIDRKLLETAADSFDAVSNMLGVVERGKLALLLPEIQHQVRRGGRRGPGGPMGGGPGGPMGGGPGQGPPMRERRNAP